MRRMLMLLLASIFLTGVSYAHGGEQHVLGTVTKITDASITVEIQPKPGETQKTSVTVGILPSTKFEKMDVAATAKDLKVGDRVVIHAAKKGDKLEAHVVKIGKAK